MVDLEETKASENYNGSATKKNFFQKVLFSKKHIHIQLTDNIFTLTNSAPSFCFKNSLQISICSTSSGKTFSNKMKNQAAY